MTQAAWSRARSCVIGRCWHPGSFDLINDIQTRTQLQRIARETNEDLDHLADIIQDLGVDVYRPDVEDAHDVRQFPPMCPGDNMLSLSGKIYHSLSDDNLRYYQSVLAIMNRHHPVIATDNLSACQAMSQMREDRVVYAQYANQDRLTVADWWHTHSHLECFQFYDHGHLDGWFCAPAPDLILSGVDPVRPALLELARNFLFPACTVIECHIDHPHKLNFQHWYQGSEQSWSLQQEIWSQNLQDFINRYLTAWTGNSQETLFEINSFVVDRHNIVMTHCSDTTYQALQERQITPHIVPWRHGLLWDAGINCVTFAIHRED